MCQFVAIKPSCGCLMNRRTDSDSCLEWDWWAHSGKMERSGINVAYYPQRIVQHNRQSRALHGHAGRAGLWMADVVVVRGCVFDKQDIDSARRRSRTDFSFFLFFKFSWCSFAVPNFLWWSRRLAAASAMVWRKSGGDRKGEVTQVRRKARKIFKAFQFFLTHISLTRDRVHYQNWLSTPVLWVIYFQDDFLVAFVIVMPWYSSIGNTAL